MPRFFGGGVRAAAAAAAFVHEEVRVSEGKRAVKRVRRGRAERERAGVERGWNTPTPGTARRLIFFNEEKPCLAGRHTLNSNE